MYFYKSGIFLELSTDLSTILMVNNKKLKYKIYLMKFFTSKSSFLEAIKFSSNFSSDNNFEQLLKNLYIKIDNKECKIYSSNGQVSSIYKIEDDIDVEEEGEVIVNAKKSYNDYSINRVW